MAQTTKYSNDWWTARAKATQDRFVADIAKYGAGAASAYWAERAKFRSMSKRAVENRVQFAKWQLRKHEDWWRTAPDAEKIGRVEQSLRREVESEERARQKMLASRPQHVPPTTTKSYAEREMERFQSDPLGYATVKYQEQHAILVTKRNYHTKVLFRLNGKWHENRKRLAANKARRKPRRAWNLRNDVQVHLEYLVFQVKRKSFKTAKHIAFRYGKSLNWVREAREVAIRKGLITEAEWKASPQRSRPTAQGEAARTV